MKSTQSFGHRLFILTTPMALLLTSVILSWSSYESWRVIGLTAGLPEIQTSRPLGDPNRSFAQGTDGQIRPLLTSREKTIFRVKGIVFPVLGLSAAVGAVIFLKKW